MSHMLNWNYEGSKMIKDTTGILIVKLDLAPYKKYRADKERFKRINSLLTFEEQTILLHALDIYMEERTEMVKKFEKTQRNMSYYDSYLKGAKEGIETAEVIKLFLEGSC